MTPFKCFKIYIALKAHFLTDYDILKYKGRVSCKEATFNKRGDRIFFKKVCLRYDPYKFMLANIVDDPFKHISDFSEDSYNRLVRVTDVLYYTFEKDIRHINNFNKDLSSENIANLYFSNKVEIETLCILNTLFKFTDKWDDNPLVDGLRKSITGYQSLINIEYGKIKVILKKKLQER